jgi:hypothetical protein
MRVRVRSKRYPDIIRRRTKKEIRNSGQRIWNVSSAGKNTIQVGIHTARLSRPNINKAKKKMKELL